MSKPKPKSKANHQNFRFHPICEIRILGEAHFPTYVGALTRYEFMKEDESIIEQEFWQYFFDGFPFAMIYN